MIPKSKALTELLIEHYIFLSTRGQAWSCNQIAILEMQPNEERELIRRLARSFGKRPIPRVGVDYAKLDLQDLNEKIRVLEKLIFQKIAIGRAAGSSSQEKVILHLLRSLFSQPEFSKYEKRALLAVFGHFFCSMVPGLLDNFKYSDELGSLLMMLWPFPRLAASNMHILGPDSKLAKQGMIDVSSHAFCELVDMQIKLGQKIMDLITSPVEAVNFEEKLCLEGACNKNRTLLELLEPKFGLNRVVLPKNIKQEILEALYFYRSSQNQDLCGRLGLKKSGLFLFSGQPGTGKTITAMAIARELGLTIGLARYDQLIDMWFGNSEKNLVECFRTAQKDKLLLLFDEADALISNRKQTGPGGGAHDTEHRLKNIFLSELERYEGVVVLTTNLVESLDPALERRLNLRIEFPIPDAGLRAKIWEKFLVGSEFLAEGVDFEELGRSFEMSGGYIKNAVEKAMRRLFWLRSKDPHRKLDQALLMQAGRAEMSSMVSKGASRGLVGFRAGV